MAHCQQVFALMTFSASLCSSVVFDQLGETPRIQPRQTEFHNTNVTGAYEVKDQTIS